MTKRTACESCDTEKVTIPACQTPHVDVFRLVQIDNWHLSQREGNVLMNIVGDIVFCLKKRLFTYQPFFQDEKIGKKCYKITGNVLAANYIQFPRVKSQTLGLTGRYLYTQASPMPSL